MAHLPLQIAVIGTLITPPHKKSKENESKEDREPTDATLFVIGAQIYGYNGITLPSHMPLTIDKNLLSINICFRITQNY